MNTIDWTQVDLMGECTTPPLVPQHYIYRAMQHPGKLTLVLFTTHDRARVAFDREPRLIGWQVRSLELTMRSSEGALLMFRSVDAPWDMNRYIGFRPAELICVGLDPAVEAYARDRIRVQP